MENFWPKPNEEKDGITEFLASEFLRTTKIPSPKVDFDYIDEENHSEILGETRDLWKVRRNSLEEWIPEDPQNIVYCFAAHLGLGVTDPHGGNIQVLRDGTCYPMDFENGGNMLEKRGHTAFGNMVNDLDQLYSDDLLYGSEDLTATEKEDFLEEWLLDSGQDLAESMDYSETLNRLAGPAIVMPDSFERKLKTLATNFSRLENREYSVNRDLYRKHCRGLSNQVFSSI